MDPGQHVDLALDIAQRLAVAAVGTGPGEDQIPHHVPLQVMPGIVERLLRDRPLGRRIGYLGRQHLGLQGRTGLGPLLLANRLLGCLEAVEIRPLQLF